MIADVNSSLVVYWQSGTSELPTELAALVDYWFEWHAIKIVISTLLLLALGSLAAALWRRSLVARDGFVSGRYTTSAACATVLALLSVFLLVANIQATTEPLVALLPLLPSDDPDPALAQTLLEITRAVDDPGSAGSPSFATLSDHVARYNWVMFAMTIPLTLVFGSGAFEACRRCRRAATDSGARRLMYALLGGACTLMVVAMSILSASAVDAVADPHGALLGIIGA